MRTVTKQVARFEPDIRESIYFPLRKQVMSMHTPDTWHNVIAHLLAAIKGWMP